MIYLTNVHNFRNFEAINGNLNTEFVNFEAENEVESEIEVKQEINLYKQLKSVYLISWDKSFQIYMLLLEKCAKKKTKSCAKH